MDLITYFEKVFEIAAPRIAQRIIDNWQAEISGGAVLPSLKPATLKAKTLKGYSNPSNPLLATGELADSLYSEIDNNIIKILSDSHVLPSWHGASLYEPDHLAENNPKREVINQELVDQIIEEEIGKALGEVK